MKRRSQEAGLALVEKYRASGLTQVKFAKKSRISVAVLRYWLRKIQEQEGGSQEPVRFVELSPARREADTSPVRIETPTGVVVLLDRLPSSDYLVELILGLRQQ